jgi:hypothetical protein
MFLIADNDYPQRTINAWNVPLDCPAADYCDGFAMEHGFARIASDRRGGYLDLACDMANWADEIRASQFGG